MIKDAEGDLVDGRWKPNKAMSLLQQLEEEHAQSLRQPEREGWVSVSKPPEDGSDVPCVESLRPLAPNGSGRLFMPTGLVEERNALDAAPRSTCRRPSIRGEVMADLKPCPFCGCSVSILSERRDYIAIYCKGCRADGPICDSWEQAISAWNRRAQDVRGEATFDEEAEEEAFEAWLNDPERRRRWHTCHTTENERIRAAFEFGRSLRAAAGEPPKEGK
jgi:Lar family restriction alleviation protein